MGTILIVRLDDGSGWRISYEYEGKKASTIVSDEDFLERGREAIDEAIEFVEKMAKEGYA